MTGSSSVEEWLDTYYCPVQCCPHLLCNCGRSLLRLHLRERLYDTMKI